ncbi:conserved hypothetical protein [Perkinsus marinus ATCC 50983]|uniref:Uncharacterized protein n=1 Tax=Perkinsus marinus (strain ATCC 50983 / TXsc) TaxID=423536 RepID=C5KH04_PERM5|nr:conserved hypothetical protein [Perkinsus marinus ATCC 50983]EER15866.1 conserved hypothetical protein [Perkinsus marinus ATCC 50983]|eukprot:XP_002784070.1 conserved hypothetical protein [Perkinsus marinus ATCC 50983]
MQTEGRHHHQHHNFRHTRHIDVDDDDDKGSSISGGKKDADAVMAELSAKTRKAMAELKKDVLVEKQVHEQFDKELKGLEPLEKNLNEAESGSEKDDDDGGDDDDDGGSFIQEGTKSDDADDKFIATLDSIMKKDELSSSEYEKGLDDWYTGFKKELISFAKSDDGDHQPDDHDDKIDDLSLAQIGAKTTVKRIKCSYDDDEDSLLQKAQGSGEDNEAQFKAEVDEEENGEERKKRCEHNTKFGIEQNDE